MGRIKFPPFLMPDYDMGESSDELLKISMSGTKQRRKAPMCTWRPNGRLDWQILYVEEGYGYFRCGEATEKVGPHALVVMKPLEPQLYAYYEQECPIVYFVHFSGSIVEELMMKMKLDEQMIYNISPSCNYKILKAFSRLNSAIALNGNNECMYWGEFIELLSVLSKSIHVDSTNEEMSTQNHDTALSVVLAEMHKDVGSQYSVADYAKKINLSPSYFAHVFKRRVGMSPIQYRNRIRMEHAKDLLITTTMTIDAIARELGYCDTAVFSKKFKEVYKMSPLHYRKSLGE